MRKIVQKKRSFNNEIKCHERPRMQDFAPFIPEALGAIKGTDGTICLLLFNFLLLLQNLLTSLHDITEILLKVALNTINGINGAKSCILGLSWHLISLLKLLFFCTIFLILSAIVQDKRPFFTTFDYIVAAFQALQFVSVFDKGAPV
jgi:hypothetical protein